MTAKAGPVIVAIWDKQGGIPGSVTDELHQRLDIRARAADWRAIRSPAVRQDWPVGRLRFRSGLYAQLSPGGPRCRRRRQPLLLQNVSCRRSTTASRSSPTAAWTRRKGGAGMKEHVVEDSDHRRCGEAFRQINVNRPKPGGRRFRERSATRRATPGNIHV